MLKKTEVENICNRNLNSNVLGFYSSKYYMRCYKAERNLP